MSGKRRRSETSWDIKQDKMPPPESLNSESNDPRRPSWEGNRSVSRNDDISRDKHRTFDDEWGKQYTTRLPHRDRSRSPIRSRSRSRGREWESRSPFYDDRHKSIDYGDHVRNNSRPCKDFGAGDRRKEGSHSRGDNLKESWSRRPDHHSGGSRYSRFPHHKDDRNHFDDDDDGEDGRRQSNRISKMRCKFFAAGKCHRDNCKFSHDASDSQDYERRSNDNIRAHKNRKWHDDQQPHADLNASDLSEKKKSWGGPTWDDVESGGFDENKKTTWDSHSFDDKKKSRDGASLDDASNPNLDNKNRSWNGPSWDDHASASGFSNKSYYNSEDTKSGGNDNNVDEKTKSWSCPLWDDPGLNEKGCDKNDYFLPKQHNLVNDSHINNDNIVSEEPNQQILTSGEGQVENGKSPKKKQERVGNLQGIAENAEQEQEHINTEKVEKGNIGNDEMSTQQCREIDPNRSRSRSREWESRSPFYDDRQKSNEYGNHVRNNSRGDNLKESWSHRQDYSRSSSRNRNSRNHYDDEDDRCQSNRVTKIRRCKFFAAGNCYRDDCKFSHDVSDAQNYDRRSHDNTRAHKKMACHDEQPHTDLNASDFSEKNTSWNGPTWDDVESGGFNENKKRTWDSHNSDDKKKSTTRDDTSNPNLDNKNKSWDDVESGGFDENKKTTWESQNSDDKKKSSRDDDLDNKNKNRSWNGPSWDEVDTSKSNAKSGNNTDEKSKAWVKMDTNKKMRKWDDDPGGLNEKGYEKNDHFLPQQHNVVNDSHLNNCNVLSEEPNQQILTSGKGQVPVPVPPLYTTEQNLANAIDYLKSLPSSTQNQDTKQPKEGNIGIGNDIMEIESGKSPKKKQESVGKRQGSENAKQEQEQEHVNHVKVKEGNIGNDEKCMRQFRVALVEFVKEILKLKWKEGRMTREVYKTVVKKVIDKITSSIQEVQIPKTQAKIELYLTHAKPKIMKLVEAYVEKLVKA